MLKLLSRHPLLLRNTYLHLQHHLQDTDLDEKLARKCRKRNLSQCGSLPLLLRPILQPLRWRFW
jgi:hypothetical protein